MIDAVLHQIFDFCALRPNDFCLLLNVSAGRRVTGNPPGNPIFIEKGGRISWEMPLIQLARAWFC